MRLLLSSRGAAATAALALALALPASRAQGSLPKLEDVASAFLSSEGVQQVINEADMQNQLAQSSLPPSQAEVWSAFLNAASNNLEGGSLQKYAQSFGELKDGDASGIFNSEVPGERAPHDAITTLRMGMDVNKQLTEIAKTATMALGMKMEDMDIGDPAWWGQVLLSGLKGNKGMQTDCAWTASASYKTANLFFPDAESIYHVMYFSQFGPQDMAMIEGDFPDARYFSVQSYDDTFSPITSMRDFEIQPSVGANHFAKKATNQLRGGKYKIFVTKDGMRGLPNELKMSHSNFSESSFGAIIFRLYGVDPLADTKNGALREWGYKNPPTISLRSSGSIDKTSFDQGWTKLRQCPPTNVEIANQAVNTAVSSRVAEISFSGDAVSCKIENVQDGFMLMSRERSSQSRSPFINADGAYLLACANARKNYIKNNDLIGVVKSYFPSTPYSKYQARFVGAPETYEMRYASLSVYDLKPPGPVLRTLSDAEVRQFYYQKYGAEKWEEDFGRNVSFIITTNQKALSRCKVDTSDSLTMSLEGLSEDQKSNPEWFGVIYRELIPQGLIINETNAAKYGMRPQDVYKKSIIDARQVMCPPDQACDSNPYRAASIMKERFPRVQWYTCSPSGVLKVADPVAAVNYDTRFDSKAVAPRSQQFFYQYCPDDKVNEVLVKVMSPSTTTAHAANQKAGTAPANTLLAYPVKVSAKEPVFVVGVSVKAKSAVDAYFKGEVEACGYSFVTDSKWTCTAKPPADNAWLTADFDDTKWERATWTSETMPVPEISDEAKYISVAAPSTKAIYCRLVVPNPTYMA